MYQYILLCKSQEFPGPLAELLPCLGSGPQLCPVLRGRGHCHVGMMLDPAGKFPISHHRVTEPPPAAVASLHLCLVQLDLCQLILVNIISCPFRVTKMGWFSFGPVPLGAVIILSQMREFLLAQGYCGSSSRGEFLRTPRGRESVAVHLSLTQQSHPDTSVYPRKNGITPRLLADETGWMISSLPGVVLIFFHLFCAEDSFPDKGTVTSAQKARDKPVDPCASERLL